MLPETSFRDLPDEMLENILSYLSFEDRKSALQVCQRLSTVKPFDFATVQLVVDFARNPGQEATYFRILLASNRPYKHLVLYFGYDSGKYDLLVEIFQHFSAKLETLKLIPHNFIPVKLKLFAQVAALGSNLRHLHIDACNFDYSRDEMDFPVMRNLEELYLENNLLSLVPSMKDITPNITRLHMQISYYSEEPQLFLRHFSSSLVELEIWFLSEDYFMTICEMQFPSLKKINFYCVDLEIDHIGSLEKIELINSFFKEIPLLTEVTLRCNIDDRVIQKLCRSCVNIQFLCVSMDYFLQESFLAVCELKQLQHLRIEEAAINVPTEMYLPIKSLQILTLYSVRIVHEDKFNEFIRDAFPNLIAIEMLHLNTRKNESRSFQLHTKITQDMSSIQRLVFSEPGTNVMVNSLLEFCETSGSLELRLRCWNIVDLFPGDETPELIRVQKLNLDVPMIAPSVMHKLISSMRELRQLEVALSDYCTPKVIDTLREQFPRCHVVAKRKVPIEEPL
ncbi:uncharacterized protein LOC134210029 [Armigeres subalbatus]|uniref:uncharacterized protein LOC134210029 n=1 Tax=Armigeres subalbatus TaxID=124917 RepID=UPI002ED07294